MHVIASVIKWIIMVFVISAIIENISVILIAVGACLLLYFIVVNPYMQIAAGLVALLVLFYFLFIGYKSYSSRQKTLATQKAMLFSKNATETRSSIKRQISPIREVSIMPKLVVEKIRVLSDYEKSQIRDFTKENSFVTVEVYPENFKSFLHEYDWLRNKIGRAPTHDDQISILNSIK